MSIYADSSFIVSVYITDRHSREARQEMQKGPHLLLTQLHRAEWANAAAQHVFRKAITPVEAQRLHSNFEHDRAEGLWQETEVPWKAFDICIDLSRLHTPQFGTRTIDTLHVAAAIELKAECFWTFDERQAKLAKAVGLKLG